MVKVFTKTAQRDRGQQVLCTWLIPRPIGISGRLSSTSFLLALHGRTFNDWCTATRTDLTNMGIDESRMVRWCELVSD